MKRATIDVDDHNFSGCVARLSTILLLSALRKINIKRIEFETTNRGYHIIAWYTGKYTKKELRKDLRDDPLRAYYDKTEKPKQILFTKKGNAKIIKTRKFYRCKKCGNNRIYGGENCINGWIHAKPTQYVTEMDKI